MSSISATDDARLHGHEWGEGSRSDQPGCGCDQIIFADDIATLIDDPWLATYWRTACELL